MKHAVSARAQGIIDGRVWAEQHAEYHQIKSLYETAHDVIQIDEDSLLHIALGDPSEAKEATIYEMFGPVAPTREYLAGFIVGAFEVWEGMKDLI